MADSLSQYREAFITESREILQALNQVLLKLEKAPDNPELVNETFRYLHNIKGMAATMGFEKITKLSHELENLMDLVRTGKRRLSGGMISAVFKGVDFLETLISGLEKRTESGELDINPVLEALRNCLSERTPRLLPEKQKPAGAIAHPEETGKPSTLRVDTKILDDLINQIGELVISKNRLSEEIAKSGSEEISNAFYYSNKILTRLENTILKTRVVATEYLFNRFPRMIRDLAQEHKKEVNLVVEGQEIGLDRGVLDELYDPLIHILRNSVYHGIENSKDRKKAKKKPAGTIKLSAREKENFVIIEVADDGGGIDIERVKQIAIKKGLVKPAKAKEMTDQECYNLLTLPGFSTVTSANSTSGRGVGMDVVKNKVESINGTFSIESKKGAGTKISLKVPLTLAIIQALIVDVSGESYALPFSRVKEVFRIDLKPNEPILYKGKQLPFQELSVSLGKKDETGGAVREVLVIDYKEKDFGLVINRIKSQHEVVVKPVSKLLKAENIFAGATVLGNGNVVLILDINTILNYNIYK